MNISEKTTKKNQKENGWNLTTLVGSFVPLPFRVIWLELYGYHN